MDLTIFDPFRVPLNVCFQFGLLLLFIFGELCLFGERLEAVLKKEDVFFCFDEVVCKYLQAFFGGFYF